MKNKQLIFLLNDFKLFSRSKSFLRFLLFVTFLFTGLTQGYSQVKITGNISDINGLPLIGANVVVKGTSNGTQAAKAKVNTPNPNRALDIFI